MKGVTRQGDWQPIESAPRDGSRILVVIRPSEQGPGVVDVARWARSQRSGEQGWVAADTEGQSQVAYAAPEVLFWMPLPAHAASGRDAVLAAGVPQPPDFDEAEGSGI